MKSVTHSEIFPFTPEFRRKLCVRNGDIIKFGRYCFSSENPVKEPILWRVIMGVMDPETDYMIFRLVSVYGIDAVPYSDTESCTWETSFLKKWLNNDFYDVAFNDDEKRYISDVDGCRVCQPEEDYDMGGLHGEELYCQATPYAAAKMKDDPEPLYGIASVYDRNSRTYREMPVVSPDVCWIVPRRISLDSRNPIKDEERSLDYDGKIRVYNYVHYDSYEEGKKIPCASIERGMRDIRLRALARPIITVSFDPLRQEVS